MIKLINVSNHPSSKWSDKQWQGFDVVYDIQFPNVDPNWNTEQVGCLVDHILDEINELDVNNIMLQGEFTLCYLLQNKLSTKTIWIPTTERKVVEVVNADGTVTKNTTFEFVRWRMI